MKNALSTCCFLFFFLSQSLSQHFIHAVFKFSLNSRFPKPKLKNCLNCQPFYVSLAQQSPTDSRRRRRMFQQRTTFSWSVTLAKSNITQEYFVIITGNRVLIMYDWGWIITKTSTRNYFPWDTTGLHTLKALLSFWNVSGSHKLTWLQTHKTSTLFTYESKHLTTSN